MIISTPKNIQPLTYASERVFVSQPYYKIVFENGLGFYILNSYKFQIFPKFYGIIKKEFWELGFYFRSWIFEIMWNKAFKVK